MHQVHKALYSKLFRTVNCSFTTLFLLGVIEQRFGTSDITALGGLAKSVPVLSGFFLSGGMASLLDCRGCPDLLANFLPSRFIPRRASHCCGRSTWHHFKNNLINRCICIKSNTASNIR